MFFLLFLLDDRRTRIRCLMDPDVDLGGPKTYGWIRIRNTPFFYLGTDVKTNGSSGCDATRDPALWQVGLRGYPGWPGNPLAAFLIEP
jgi:hypothetical protein